MSQQNVGQPALIRSSQNGQRQSGGTVPSHHPSQPSNPINRNLQYTNHTIPQRQGSQYMVNNHQNNPRPNSSQTNPPPRPTQQQHITSQTMPASGATNIPINSTRHSQHANPLGLTSFQPNQQQQHQQQQQRALLTQQHSQTHVSNRNATNNQQQPQIYRQQPMVKQPLLHTVSQPNNNNSNNLMNGQNLTTQHSSHPAPYNPPQHHQQQQGGGMQKVLLHKTAGNLAKAHPQHPTIKQDMSLYQSHQNIIKHTGYSQQGHSQDVENNKMNINTAQRVNQHQQPQIQQRQLQQKQFSNAQKQPKQELGMNHEQRSQENTPNNRARPPPQLFRNKPNAHSGNHDQYQQQKMVVKREEMNEVNQRTHSQRNQQSQLSQEHMMNKRHVSSQNPQQQRHDTRNPQVYSQMQSSSQNYSQSRQQIGSSELHNSQNSSTNTNSSNHNSKAALVGSNIGNTNNNQTRNHDNPTRTNQYQPKAVPMPKLIKLPPGLVSASNSNKKKPTSGLSQADLDDGWILNKKASSVTPTNPSLHANTQDTSTQHHNAPVKRTLSSPNQLQKNYQNDTDVCDSSKDCRDNNSSYVKRHNEQEQEQLLSSQNNNDNNLGNFNDDFDSEQNLSSQTDTNNHSSSTTNHTKRQKLSNNNCVINNNFNQLGNDDSSSNTYLSSQPNTASQQLDAQFNNNTNQSQCRQPLQSTKSQAQNKSQYQKPTQSQFPPLPPTTQSQLFPPLPPSTQSQSFTTMRFGSQFPYNPLSTPHNNKGKHDDKFNSRCDDLDLSTQDSNLSTQRVSHTSKTIDHCDDQPNLQLPTQNFNEPIHDHNNTHDNDQDECLSSPKSTKTAHTTTLSLLSCPVSPLDTFNDYTTNDDDTVEQTLSSPPRSPIHKPKEIPHKDTLLGNNNRKNDHNLSQLDLNTEDLKTKHQDAEMSSASHLSGQDQRNSQSRSSCKNTLNVSKHSKHAANPPQVSLFSSIGDLSATWSNIPNIFCQHQPHQNSTKHTNSLSQLPHIDLLTHSVSNQFYSLLQSTQPQLTLQQNNNNPHSQYHDQSLLSPKPQTNSSLYSSQSPSNPSTQPNPTQSTQTSSFQSEQLLKLTKLTQIPKHNHGPYHYYGGSIQLLTTELPSHNATIPSHPHTHHQSLSPLQLASYYSDLSIMKGNNNIPLAKSFPLYFNIQLYINIMSQIIDTVAPHLFNDDQTTLASNNSILSSLMGVIPAQKNTKSTAQVNNEAVLIHYIETILPHLQTLLKSPPQSISTTNNSIFLFKAIRIHCPFCSPIFSQPFLSLEHTHKKNPAVVGTSQNDQRGDVVKQPPSDPFMDHTDKLIETLFNLNSSSNNNNDDNNRSSNNLINSTQENVFSGTATQSAQYIQRKNQVIIKPPNLSTVQLHPLQYARTFSFNVQPESELRLINRPLNVTWLNDDGKKKATYTNRQILNPHLVRHINTNYKFTSHLMGLNDYSFGIDNTTGKSRSMVGDGINSSIDTQNDSFSVTKNTQDLFNNDSMSIPLRTIDDLDYVTIQHQHLMLSSAQHALMANVTPCQTCQSFTHLSSIMRCPHHKNHGTTFDQQGNTIVGACYCDCNGRGHNDNPFNYNFQNDTNFAQKQTTLPFHHWDFLVLEYEVQQKYVKNYNGNNTSFNMNSSMHDNESHNNDNDFNTQQLSQLHDNYDPFAAFNESFMAQHQNAQNIKQSIILPVPSCFLHINELSQSLAMFTKLKHRANTNNNFTDKKPILNKQASPLLVNFTHQFSLLRPFFVVFPHNQSPLPKTTTQINTITNQESSKALTVSSNNNGKALIHDDTKNNYHLNPYQSQPDQTLQNISLIYSTIFTDFLKFCKFTPVQLPQGLYQTGRNQFLSSFGTMSNPSENLETHNPGALFITQNESKFEIGELVLISQYSSTCCCLQSTCPSCAYTLCMVISTPIQKMYKSHLLDPFNLTSISNSNNSEGFTAQQSNRNMASKQNMYTLVNISSFQLPTFTQPVIDQPINNPHDDPNNSFSTQNQVSAQSNEPKPSFDNNLFVISPHCMILHLPSNLLLKLPQQRDQSSDNSTLSLLSNLHHIVYFNAKLIELSFYRRFISSLQQTNQNHINLDTANYSFQSMLFQQNQQTTELWCNPNETLTSNNHHHNILKSNFLPQLPMLKHSHDSNSKQIQEYNENKQPKLTQCVTKTTEKRKMITQIYAINPYTGKPSEDTDSKLITMTDGNVGLSEQNKKETIEEQLSSTHQLVENSLFITPPWLGQSLSSTIVQCLNSSKLQQYSQTQSSITLRCKQLRQFIFKLYLVLTGFIHLPAQRSLNQTPLEDCVGSNLPETQQQGLYFNPTLVIQKFVLFVQQLTWFNHTVHQSYSSHNCLIKQNSGVYQSKCNENGLTCCWCCCPLFQPILLKLTTQFRSSLSALNLRTIDNISKRQSIPTCFHGELFSFCSPLVDTTVMVNALSATDNIPLSSNPLSFINPDWLISHQSQLDQTILSVLNSYLIDYILL